MANGYSIIVGLVIVVIASVLAYLFSPKGETQTIWRSSLILAFVSCYLMWAITLLAQLHPLISPKRSDLRPESVHADRMMGF
ncbi:ATP synthase subunit H-domain-containing protein [Tricharina praecox]|uniref:ATP synthase subunit H-domain-containing protein n=1 Tax=Tricharina praecox TaxID=43433 RepID=UPI00221EA3DC|nr:ATP synthase subunit H-domain-containing protein [Tricharina praecox]KAI5848842.1 ATP synthase subunit H-domain-containing protein [Tricharina praecox]